VDLPYVGWRIRVHAVRTGNDVERVTSQCRIPVTIGVNRWHTPPMAEGT
jgi:hypothetical protein